MCKFWWECVLGVVVGGVFSSVVVVLIVVMGVIYVGMYYVFWVKSFVGYMLMVV